MNRSARAWVAGALAVSLALSAGAAGAVERITVYGGRVIALPLPAEPELVDFIRVGERETALSMIAAGADVNGSTSGGNGTTALHWAAYQQDEELVEALLAAGAEPTVYNILGTSPLMEAAIVGNTAIIRLLLEAGVDVESRNPEGQTALMAVARTGNLEAAGLLLEAGADPNAREAWGNQTAVMWAAARHHPDMIRLLGEYGADPNARAFDRVWERRNTATPLTPPGKDMEFGGMTAALFAAREGCAPCIPALVEIGVDLDVGNRNGTTPLVVSLMNLRWDTAVELIRAGADVNQWDIFGRSPVYQAVDTDTQLFGGRPDIPSFDLTQPKDVLVMLLEAGADPDIPLRIDPPRRAVIFDRTRDGGDNVLSTGATALFRAVLGGDNPGAAAILLQYGANQELYNGETPLYVAVKNRSGSYTRGTYKNTEADALATAMALVEFGVDVNARNSSNGQVALHASVSRGHVLVIEFLLRQGASPTIQANNQATPLSAALWPALPVIHLVSADLAATEEAALDAARGLVEAGIARVNQGFATSNAQTGATQVNEGLDVLNLRYMDGRTLLEVAQQRGWQVLIDYLRSVAQIAIEVPEDRAPQFGPTLHLNAPSLGSVAAAR